MMISDGAQPSSGELSLAIEDEAGHSIAKQAMPFEIPALGQMTYLMDFDIPGQTGHFVLEAIAQPRSAVTTAPTISRRWVELAPNQTEPTNH